MNQKNITWWLARTTYPILWGVVIVCCWWAVNQPWTLTYLAIGKGIVVVASLLALEYFMPLDKRWRMTKSLFLRRDLVMLVGNGGVALMLNYGLLLLALDASQEWHGFMTGKPLWLQVSVGLLAFEALQYSLHRFMHMDGNAVAAFLWRCHAIHHLPQQLYVVMHAVFHPINMILVRVIVQLTPLWVLGFDPLAVFIYGSVIGLHGAISHLNFDLRLGWFNYVFVGPELHRYHHSAKHPEALNFGAALVICDLAMGTFRYTPGRYPESLGLDEVHGYPGQLAPIDALCFPFRQANRDYDSSAAG